MNTTKYDIKDYKEKLEEIKKIENEIKDDIIFSIVSAKRKEENKLCTFIKFSELSPISWSPEYYNTNSQLDRIIDIIENCKTIEDIKTKLEMLFIEKRIIEKNYKVILNEKTLQVIKDELNKLSSL